MRRWLLLTAVAAVAGWTADAHAQARRIDPLLNLDVSQIFFDDQINPLDNPFDTTLTDDAQTVLRAHRVAREQVQAAINYLWAHKARILAGEDAFFNEIFGNYYDPNRADIFGEGPRTIRQPITDAFGNVVGFEEVPNDEFFDVILAVFEGIFDALGPNQTVTYGLGAQNERTPVDWMAFFGPLFTPFGALWPLDPLREDLFAHYTEEIYPFGPFSPFPFPPVGPNRGARRWGLSNSLSAAHFGTPNLEWYLDNDAVYVIDPNTGLPVIDPVTGLPVIDPNLSYAFYREKLDIYGATLVDIFGNPIHFMYLGNVFFTERERAGGLLDGTPRLEFQETELRQYQMIVMAFAELFGAEGNVRELFGDDVLILGLLDSKAFALFVDLFRAGGVGNATTQPPFGKNADFKGNFLPIIL